MEQSKTRVVILSYNGKEVTLGCLGSLISQCSDDLGIIVVDNASTDGSAAAIKSSFPNVQLVLLSENRGWAGGNNVGVSLALEQGADVICLLNNDTIVPNGAMEKLVRTCREMSPCLLHPAIDYAEPDEGPQLDPSAGSYPQNCCALAITETLFELDFAYGACLAVSAETFRRVGLFDERFFLQMEETDFFLRAKQNGIPSLCTVTARIFHYESKSFGGRSTPWKFYYIARNSLLLAEKHTNTLLGWFKSIRGLYWSTSTNLRKNTYLGDSIHPIFWITSDNLYLVALRLGIRDYLFRRFGSASPSIKRRLQG